MKLTLLIIYAYLSGSIPFGLIISKMKGVDPRKVGSGNIGATNVMRSVGKSAAFFTLFGDMLKGMVPVAIGNMLGLSPLSIGIIGLSAIAGHITSPFLGFRGGKGVATGIGVILIYVPKAGILAVIVWLVTLLITRYSSLGALVSFGLLPLAVLILGYSKEQAVISLAITAIIVIRHSDNIKRLIKRQERRMCEKP